MSSSKLKFSLPGFWGFGKLGNYNLACVSIFCILGGFASTTLIKRLGCNVCLIIGALGDA